MAHVLYALFPSREDAEAALAEAVQRGVPTEHLEVVVHPEPVRDPQELALSETDGRHGLVRGGLLGALAGLLTMGVLVTLVGGPVGTGALAAAALGIVAGGVYGAWGAGLAGLELPDRDLEPLLDAVGDGRVLVTTEVRHEWEERLIEQTFARHGAVEERKHVA